MYNRFHIRAVDCHGGCRCAVRKGGGNFLVNLCNRKLIFHSLGFVNINSYFTVGVFAAVVNFRNPFNIRKVCPHIRGYFLQFVQVVPFYFNAYAAAAGHTAHVHCRGFY